MELIKVDHIKWMERHLKRKRTLRRIGGIVGDFLAGCWYLVRYHYIGLFTIAVSIGLFYYQFTTSFDLMLYVLSGIILVLGIGFDLKNNQFGPCV